jgi:ATP-citrate lyase beta-subunit
MARVKMTEYRAKKLILGEDYGGISVRSGLKSQIPAGTYVAKVDQGIKKRFKQGLVAINKKPAELGAFFKAMEKKGFSQFIVEPMFPHEASEEQYFSLERVREGLRLLHAKDGGVNIEEHPEQVLNMILASREDCAAAAMKTGIPQKFLERLYDVFNENFFAFLEINPLIVRGDEVFLLDAAVLVDSTAQFFVGDTWSDADVVKSKANHPNERAVEALAATTPAALSLKVLNTDGSLFFLLSGGGGSIVIADEVAARGMGDMLGNYGEYSGGPTREETYLYAKEVLELMLGSKSKKKALVIAGGVANFTDIKQTFAGIIDALIEAAPKMRKVGIKVFVRRGGPNEAAGLSAMKAFLEKEDLFGAVYGSNTIITQAAEDAIDFVSAKGGSASGGQK